MNRHKHLSANGFTSKPHFHEDHQAFYSLCACVFVLSSVAITVQFCQRFKWKWNIYFVLFRSPVLTQRNISRGQNDVIIVKMISICFFFFFHSLFLRQNALLALPLLFIHPSAIFHFLSSFVWVCELTLVCACGLKQFHFEYSNVTHLFVMTRFFSFVHIIQLKHKGKKQRKKKLKIMQTKCIKCNVQMTFGSTHFDIFILSTRSFSFHSIGHDKVNAFHLVA